MKYILVIMLLLLMVGFAFAQENISYEETIRGELIKGERDEYSFEATKGDFIAISQTSEVVDSYLYLIDLEGNELAVDDDGGSGFNALIGGFNIPATGTYIIQAASFDDGGSGEYELTLMLKEVTVLSYGDTVESKDSMGVFSFEGSKGDVIVASMATASGSETTLSAIGPDGYNFASGTFINDQNKHIGPVELTGDGTYLLMAIAEDTFSLSLQQPGITPLIVGEATAGKFSPSSDSAYFSLSIEYGRVINFTLDSAEDLDTEMKLFGPSGYEIAASELSSGQFSIDAVGVYHLVVSRLGSDETSTDEFTITARESNLPTLDDGPQTIMFDPQTNTHVLTFTGEAGQVVDIHIVIEGQREFSLPSIQLLQNETELVYVTTNGLNRAQFEVTVPDNGDVTLIAQAYGNVLLTIEVLKEAE